MSPKKKAVKDKDKEISTKLPVYGMDGKVSGHLLLDEKLFDGKINKVLLYEVNKMYEANQRKGTASTKTRSEVSGGGIKPWRQKGTGRARVGSTRNPLWRHGGVAFGPKPRDYSYSMPVKSMRKALLSGLNARLREDMMKLTVKLELPEVKTKAFKAILDNLKMDNKVLVVVSDNERNVKLSSRNLKEVTVMEAAKINARDVLLNDHILVEKDAVRKLEERLR